MPAATSISPVARSGFTVPSGRGRTRPSTRSTYSARMRVRVEPARRVGVDDDLDDPGRVAQVEEHDAAVVAPARDPAAQRDVPVDVADRAGPRPGRCASTSRSRRPLHGVAAQQQPARHLLGGDLDLLAAGQVLDRRRSPAPPRGGRASRRSGPPTGRRASTGPSPTGRRTPGRRRGRLRAAPRPARSRSSRRPRRPRTRRGRPRTAASTPSASQAIRTRSMPMPNPMPGVGGPPISSASSS